MQPTSRNWSKVRVVTVRPTLPPVRKFVLEFGWDHIMQNAPPTNCRPKKLRLLPSHVDLAIRSSRKSAKRPCQLRLRQQGRRREREGRGARAKAKGGMRRFENSWGGGGEIISGGPSGLRPAVGRGGGRRGRMERKKLLAQSPNKSSPEKRKKSRRVRTARCAQCIFWRKRP